MRKSTDDKHDTASYAYDALEFLVRSLAQDDKCKSCGLSNMLDITLLNVIMDTAITKGGEITIELVTDIAQKAIATAIAQIVHGVAQNGVQFTIAPTGKGH